MLFGDTSATTVIGSDALATRWVRDADEVSSEAPSPAAAAPAVARTPAISPAAININTRRGTLLIGVPPFVTDQAGRGRS
jgi:hypothetical protein